MLSLNRKVFFVQQGRKAFTDCFGFYSTADVDLIEAFGPLSSLAGLILVVLLLILGAKNP